MAAGWQMVAFPLILPWRREFWTLPRYFPDLKVGVTPGWPPEMPYQGMGLPPEAEEYRQKRQLYKLGDLRQWQAFKEYQEAQGVEGDLLRQIRNYGQKEEPPPGGEEELPEPWPLAWQLEKMEADQEAQMLLVDQGQEWLGEILAPEPWEEGAPYQPVPGVLEMADPDLARLRYHLWRRVMAPHLKGPWAPLLLGRNSRALFLALRGWPEADAPQMVQVPLPGCRDAQELAAVKEAGARAGWQEQFTELLTATLNATARFPELKAAAERLAAFAAETLMAGWPFPVTWKWVLEIWAPAPADTEEGPVLCWSGAAGAKES
jgi:hypothetical protein